MSSEQNIGRLASEKLLSDDRPGNSIQRSCNLDNFYWSKNLKKELEPRQSFEIEAITYRLTVPLITCFKIGFLLATVSISEEEQLRHDVEKDATLNFKKKYNTQYKT